MVQRVDSFFIRLEEKIIFFKGNGHFCIYFFRSRTYFSCVCVWTYLFVCLWWEDSYKHFHSSNRIHSFLPFPRYSGFIVDFIKMSSIFLSFFLPFYSILFYFIGFNWNHGYGLIVRLVFCVCVRAIDLIHSISYCLPSPIYLYLLSISFNYLILHFCLYVFLSCWWVFVLFLV